MTSTTGSRSTRRRPSACTATTCCPFLLGEQLVARVDLKSDRERGALLVQGAFAEPEVDRGHVAAELAAELRLVATWLGLERVELAGRGDLSGELAAFL